MPVPATPHSCSIGRREYPEPGARATRLMPPRLAKRRSTPRSDDSQMILEPIPASADQAPDLRFWVELRGFEPLTPSMRTRCATGLRYSPKTGSQRTKPQAYSGSS